MLIPKHYSKTQQFPVNIEYVGIWESKLNTKGIDILRKDIREIFDCGVLAVDPGEGIKRYVSLNNNILAVGEKSYDLREIKDIYVVGAGKGAASMGKALEDILGDRIKDGVINVKYGYTADLKRIRLNEAGHPIPDEKGMKGAREIIDLLKKTGEDDLVICLITGGASALLPLPAEGISLKDKQLITDLLLRCGASIREINSIRKHISGIKGGNMARAAYPSRLITLILSDVIGDIIDIIGSGPTVHDNSTYSDCMEIFKNYDLTEDIPASIIRQMERGINREIEETPSADDPIFSWYQNIIIGGNILTLKASLEKANSLGYNALILSSFIEGETADVAKVHAAIAKEIISSGSPLSPPACVISGGETTVTIHGEGKGGRNQEFVLAAAIEIDGLNNVVILSGGTDGTDGPTDAAGAIADGSTAGKAKKMGLDPYNYLRNNDSYHFFQKTKDLLITGPTNTNVMDLRVVLVD